MDRSSYWHNTGRAEKCDIGNLVVTAYTSLPVAFIAAV
jgi:hypothetical protein